MPRKKTKKPSKKAKKQSKKRVRRRAVKPIRGRSTRAVKVKARRIQSAKRAKTRRTRFAKAKARRAVARKRRVKPVKKRKTVKKKTVKRGRLIKKRNQPTAGQPKAEKKPIKKVKKRIIRKPGKKKPIKKIRKKPTTKKLIRKKFIKKTQKIRPSKRVFQERKSIKEARFLVRRAPQPRRSKRIRLTDDLLEQLFDSSVKARLLRLFLRNSDQKFRLGEIAKRIQVTHRSVSKQIDKLRNIKLLRTKLASFGEKKAKKRVYYVNPNFGFYEELRALVLKSSPASKERMLKNIKRLGRVKLALLSGIFTNSENSRADLLIVADDISQRKLNTFLRNLEAEAGKDVDCVVMDSKEFDYRYDMCDKFLLDLLEEKNEKLINKLEL